MPGSVVFFLYVPLSETGLGGGGEVPFVSTCVDLPVPSIVYCIAWKQLCGPGFEDISQ